MPPDLTVLIVSHNTRDLLERCLRSLLRLTTELEFELVVVDNASTDGAWEAVESLFPGAVLCRLDRNVGFAAGVNRGLREVVTDFVLILNPDTLIPRGSVTKLRDFLRNHAQAAVAGASLTDPDGSPQTSAFRFPSLFREFWNFLPEVKSALHIQQAALRLGWAGNRRRNNGGREAVPVECISGAAFMARTEALRQVGGFDDRFFLYHEEMDLCVRLCKAGWGVYYLPDTQIIHWNAQASGYRPSRLPEMPLLGWRVAGMDLLWQKHRPGVAHRRWRRLARSLLGIRVLANHVLAVFPVGGRATRRERIRDLLSVLEMLRRDVERERA